MKLFHYIGGVCKHLNCHPLQVGGYRDHVHIVTGLAKNITIANLIQEMKQSSSKWAKSQGLQYNNFFWQDGYGAYSVDYKDLDRLIDYVRNQRVHHQKTSFEDECRKLFKENGIDFDENYFWK